MRFNPGISLTVLASVTLGASSSDPDSPTHTVTQTNYILPSCLQRNVEYALNHSIDANSNQPQEGIQIVFVYNNNEDDDNIEQTIGSSSNSLTAPSAAVKYSSSSMTESFDTAATQIGDLQTPKTAKSPSKDSSSSSTGGPRKSNNYADSQEDSSQDSSDDTSKNNSDDTSKNSSDDTSKNNSDDTSEDSSEEDNVNDASNPFNYDAYTYLSGSTYINSQDRYEAISTTTTFPTETVVAGINNEDYLEDSPARALLVDEYVVPTTTYLLYTANFSSNYIYPTTTKATKTTTRPNPLITDEVKISSSLPHTIDTSTITYGVEVTQLPNGDISRILIFDNSTTSANSSSSASISTASVITQYTNSSVSVSTLRPTTLRTLSRGSKVDSASLAASTSDSQTEPSFNLVKRATSNANGFSGDIFKAISTNALSSKFSRQKLPLAIPSNVGNKGKYETNKFYDNLFLGTQTDMIWSYPYGMQWSKANYFGFAVQHTITANRVFGTANNLNSATGNPTYYFNPIGIKEMIISATQFTSSKNVMSVSDMKVMSANVKMSTDGKTTTNYIEIPIVQGMGMVTSIYRGTSLTPRLNSAVGFSKLVAETSTNLKTNVIKYRATLFSGTQYLIYVTLPSGYTTSSFKFSIDGSYALKGSSKINGLIVQLAVAPSSTSQDKYYDQTAGMYTTEAKIKAHGYAGNSAEYRFSYNTAGTSKSGKPIVFTLSHHNDAFTSATKNAKTGVTLPSTTKGDMNALLASEVIMTETLHPEIQFLPWLQQLGTGSISYTKAQLKLIAEVANKELSVNIPTAVMSGGMYTSGKLIDKYAYILLVVHDILGDTALAKTTLASLKTAFATFVANKQTSYPLMYDTKFGGITSTASQGGDTGADYGSAYYNDHHFHYGYFVHAAAIVGHVDSKIGDGKWIKDNQFWVNSLIRDVANPSPDDAQFPIFRMFDWFAGHSWAAGLFEAGDGRNEESTSEDYNFAYGTKLWGRVSGNKRMEQVGDLMLSVMKRSINKYFYYTTTNTVEPSKIIPNKVSGILFDNKIDYTTWFGTNLEYVHGIHMLPISPASSLIRGSAYVKEEWNSKLSSMVDGLTTGWRGILKLNQALFDPKSSYAFFSSSSFSDSYLDNGQSRTWSLAFSGGLLNVSI